MLFAVLEIMFNTFSHYAFLFFTGFFAVLAAFANEPLAGAPLAPFLRIVSPEPALIRFFLAAMFEYNPRFAIGAFLLVFYLL
jgi:hypothetical protein